MSTALILTITIYDNQTEQSVTLRHLQELYILQPEFRGQTTLHYNQIKEFVRKHPAYSIRVQAVGVPS